MEIGKKTRIILNNIKIETPSLTGTSDIGIGTTLLEHSYSSNIRLKIHNDTLSIRIKEY